MAGRLKYNSKPILLNNIRIQIKNKENVCQSQFAQNEHFRNILTFYAGTEKQIFELLVVSSTEKFDTFLAIISLMANKLRAQFYRLKPLYTARAPNKQIET